MHMPHNLYTIPFQLKKSFLMDYLIVYLNYK